MRCGRSGGVTSIAAAPERFACGCAAIHSQIALRGGDHVFIPTTSLFDLLGLARFLQETQGVGEVMWHGLFHYGFLQGREPQYAQQEAVERQVHRQLEYLLQHIPRGRLRLYGTTQRLVEQYNRLLLSEFEVLPFPVDAHALRGAALPEASRKLRLTCAGYLRREKGKVLASRFVEGLWSNELAAGHMQLVVQTNRRQALRMLPRNAVVPMDFKSALSDTDADPIVWLRHPLTREAYIDLIRQSDMAVFLHEDRAYYTRCSGVLVEMLAGGVPVLVPAGSWLADQVSESIYEQLDGLRSTAPGIGRATIDRVTGRTGYPVTGGSVLSRCGGTAADAAGELEVPTGTCAALVSCQWHAHACPGTYLRLAAEPVGQLAEQDSLSVVTILGPRPFGKLVSALVPVPDGTRRIKLRTAQCVRRRASAGEQPGSSFSGATSQRRKFVCGRPRGARVRGRRPTAAIGPQHARALRALSGKCAGFCRDLAAPARRAANRRAAARVRWFAVPRRGLIYEAATNHSGNHFATLADRTAGRPSPTDPLPRGCRDDEVRQRPAHRGAAPRRYRYDGDQRGRTSPGQVRHATPWSDARCNVT